MSFTHLQVRSGYSFLESTNTVEKLVRRAHELGYHALALTDEEVLYGSISFYKTCLNYGIKPLIGMIVNVMVTPETTEQCVLLAKNNHGYHQLIRLSSAIQRSGQTGISIAEISGHASDLVCILPVHTGEMARLLNERTHDQAHIYVSNWTKIFNIGDFYLGIQKHDENNVEHLNQSVKVFHEATNIPVVAINDVRYLNEQDDVAYDCLQAIKHDEQWEMKQSGRMLKQRHLRSKDEMSALFTPFWPEVLHETGKVQRKCNVSFDFETSHMPSFPIPEDQDAHTYLRDLCIQKLPQRYLEITKQINERLSYELQVIQEMAFSDYFLIVADYIDYARRHNIPVGPGRGSAAGSIVAYALGITDVDPLAHGLLFERFLNPERVTMPDIDVDFSDQRRDEVIDYVREKYGDEHVAQIITFGTFGARSLLRELFKTMDIDYRDASYILAKIPSQNNQSIAASIKNSPDLLAYIKQSPKLRVLFTIATKLEGLPRHLSTHAAGVVIGEKKLVEYLPLTVGTNKTNLTQYPMNDLEAIGLLKMDFLGLRNLNFLDNIVRSIQFSANQSLSLESVPDNDPKTFALLQKGLTNGVFQLESRGMRRVLTQLKPTSFGDIVAVNALYRPGPMDYISTYIKRKNGQEEITYLHPDIEPILSETYGVLVYQEQIMRITHLIAGFTLGEADILRRAIGKKDTELITQQEESFIQGCLKRGYSQSMASQLFSWIVKFSNYGFNKSHAVAYSKISYQLAYLKANYPYHFIAELLGSSGNQKEKISEYIKEARALEVTILPPSINKSYGKYSVEHKGIRMGLQSIQGISYPVTEEIIKQRKDRPFTDIFDFCMRVSLKIVQRKTLELLIMAGTFDETYNNRASLIASIDQAIEKGELFGGLSNQSSLFPDHYGIKERYTEIEDFSQMKKLTDEKELLGMYLSNHPLKMYRKRLQINGYVPFNEALKMKAKGNVKSAAVVQSIRKIRTKRGDPMAFITIGDETHDMEAVIFPALYRQEYRWIVEEKMVFITGKLEERDGRIQWLLSAIQPFNEQVLMTVKERLFIKLTKDDYEQTLATIKEISYKYPGDTPVIIFDKKNKKTYQLSRDYNLYVNDNCLRKLKKSFGDMNVVLDG